MPGVDSCQPQVERALRKAGWQIQARQIYLGHPILEDGLGVFIDLQVADNAERSVYLEVKCFLPDGENDDFFRAVGQYLTYRSIMRGRGDIRPLHLALSHRTYAVLSLLLRTMLSELGIMLVLINLDEERITQWIE
jgi:hypothetical protein